MKINKKQLHQIELTSIRKKQKEDGMFDGRYKTTSITPKKKYGKKDRRANKQINLE